MLAVRIEVPFATFRKSFARSFAESYPLPPPATVYGMLLSLVGERHRRRHEGVRLAFAFKNVPRVATTLRKLSRYKYGVPGKQSSFGNAPDYVETVCGLEFVCWMDSNHELGCSRWGDSGCVASLEDRVAEAISAPEKVSRYGVLCLGLSDDAIDDVERCDLPPGLWLPLLRRDDGEMELPVWVDHVGAVGTRWQRFHLQREAVQFTIPPPSSEFTPITGEK